MDISPKLRKVILRAIFFFFLSLILPCIFGLAIEFIGACFHNNWLIDLSHNEFLPYLGLPIYSVWFIWLIWTLRTLTEEPESSLKAVHKPNLKRKFRFHSGKKYACYKCNKQIPNWVVKYFSKDDRTYCEIIDNYATHNARIEHINCSRPPLTEGKS